MKFWGQSFSQGHYPPIYQQAEKGFIYFITLRIISESERTSIVPGYFVDFFCVSRHGIVNQPFIYPSLASSAKSLFRFSLTNLNLFIL